MIHILPSVLKEIGSIFNKAGHQVYLVGGAVRNKLMGLDMADFDLTTDARPEEVSLLFRRVIPTGIQHGTVTVLYKKHEFEITTFRVESDYSNKRHPDSIAFTPDILEDLKRRDFTINSIALNLVSNEMVDPHDGRGDIKKGIIRCIGDPVERFNEDGLRLMRAVRFMTQLHFEIEEQTLAALSGCRANLEQVSAERLRDELVKILLSEQPSRGILLMEKTGILEYVLPELLKGRGVLQKGNHTFDVFDHSVYACDGAPRESLELRLAALLHDIGKPESMKIDKEGIPTFHNHEVISAKQAHRIMRRLKFPVKTENEVAHLITHHMFNYQEEWSDGAVRRFLARSGKESVDSLFALRRADQYGMSGNKVDSANLIAFKKHIEAVLAEEHALKIGDLAINGNILSNDADVPKGPLMGVVLEFLLESVIEDPGLNEREKLIELARNFYTTRLKTK